MFIETRVSERKTLLSAERPSGRSGGQWCVQREAARQTVSQRPGLRCFVFHAHLKYLICIKDLCRFHIPRRLVSTLTLLSKKLNCYKVTLECSPQNMAFYQKFGYNASAETYMQCRFSDWGLHEGWTLKKGHQIWTVIIILHPRFGNPGYLAMLDSWHQPYSLCVNSLLQAVKN